MITQEKNNYRIIEAKTEIISPSTISSEFVWPDSDPRLLKQDCREYCFSDEEKIEHAATAAFDLASISANKKDTIEDRIIELLNNPLIQFNSQKRFANNEIWRKRIASACKDGRPIEILLLAFCVINNPIKRFQGTSVTAAEIVSLLYMRNVSRYISSIYSPGIIFNVISDSTFYSPTMKINAIHAKNYIQELNQKTQDMGLDNVIKIIDITDILIRHSTEFDERFLYWLKQFEENPLSDGLSAVEYRQWIKSMVLSLNTKSQYYSYEQLRLIYGKYSGDKYTELQVVAEKTLIEYRALKAASSDIGWENKYFSNSIRATIHSKKAPVLGFRIYPQYKRGSQLLPYHGIAIIYNNSESSKYSMDIKQEIVVCGNKNYRKVIDKIGTTMFYENIC